MVRKFMFVVLIGLVCSCSSNGENSEKKSDDTYLNVEAITGSWGGSLSTSLAPNWNVKMRLTYSDSDSVVIGKVYWSSAANSEAHIAGDHHATIEMKIINNKFEHVEIIDLGRTGCPGVFKGSGEMISENEIKLRTPGKDCAGEHTYFNITLKKL